MAPDGGHQPGCTPSTREAAERQGAAGLRDVVGSGSPTGPTVLGASIDTAPRTLGATIDTAPRTLGAVSMTCELLAQASWHLPSGGVAARK